MGSEETDERRKEKAWGDMKTRLTSPAPANPPAHHSAPPPAHPLSAPTPETLPPCSARHMLGGSRRQRHREAEAANQQLLRGYAEAAAYSREQSAKQRRVLQQAEEGRAKNFLKLKWAVLEQRAVRESLLRLHKSGDRAACVSPTVRQDRHRGVARAGIMTENPCYVFINRGIVLPACRPMCCFTCWSKY